MSDITHYGFTCDKCPSRGIREVVGDFVGVTHYETTKLPQTWFNGNLGLSNDYTTPTGTKYIPIGFPDRCKDCNARYQRHKRARECTTRLNYVLNHQRMKYLKFVTLTHATMSSRWRLDTSPREAIDEFYSWFVDVRREIISRFNGVAGTDVLEVIEHVHTCPIFGFEFKRFHVHQHGIWCIPFINFKKWNLFKKEFDIGRSEITSIKDIHNPDTGKTIEALWQATDYLSKYISKENTHIKRMVWGAVRQWRDYAPIHKDLICKKCIKTTFDLEKLMSGRSEVCNCLTQ